jgi:hypothetical protein
MTNLYLSKNEMDERMKEDRMKDSQHIRICKIIGVKPLSREQIQDMTLHFQLKCLDTCLS